MSNIPYALAKKIETGGSGGSGGSDGATFFPEVSEEGIISWTNNGGFKNPDPVDIRGKDGEEGFSPIITEEDIGTGYRITIQDKEGEDTFDLLHGFSPIISENPTETGYQVNITDKEGTHTFELTNGEAGATPDIVMEVNVDDTTGRPDVDVTKSGTLLHPVYNLQFSGLKGEKGESGFSPTISEEDTEQGHEVTVTDESGSKTFTVHDGIDGQAGTTPNIVANATITGTTGTPSVNVTKDGTLENPIFSFEFENLKGEQGIQGIPGNPGRDGTSGKDGKDGTTPDITVEVSVDDTSGTPSATVTRRGELATPIYNIAFSGIKGYKGDTGEKGDTGNTPNISASATVSSTTGTPSVNVTKTGTADNPNFAFAFSNLKGDKGDKGEDGTIGTTPDISVSASVDNNVGTPSVTVTKSGDIHTPNFDFAFENLKGQTGATPNISATATVSSSQGTPSVNVTKSGTAENPSFAFAFGGLKGETGQSGQDGQDGEDGFTPTISTTPITDGYNITITNKTGSETIAIHNGEDGTVGTTPDISATATVNSTVGTPNVTVTKTGEILTPSFNFAFENIKGEPGQNGTTPDITATATVDSNVGVPAVTVTKSGTLANPSYAFAFSNLKGEKGDTGSQGIQGEPGVQGVPGIAGQDGITYTPEIGTITTVDAFEDADASVTIQGTRAIFDFSIPRGEKGDSGATGVNIIQYTMLLTGWVDNIYSFESQFPFASYNLEIEPNGDLITEQQLRAWNEGQMTGSYSANRCIAMGNVPTTNIPIILKVTSKGE